MFSVSGEDLVTKSNTYSVWPKEKRKSTVEHDFNGHEVNGKHGVYGTKCYNRAFHLVNKLHDFTGIHDLSGNFCYDDFFRKTHARLYIIQYVEAVEHNSLTFKVHFDTFSVFQTVWGILYLKVR